MGMPTVPEYDLIVVGAGPSGAVLAALVAEHGHRILVLERDAVVYPLPRAVHMDHEIMRVLQQLDLIGAIDGIACGVDDYLFQNAAGENLLEIRGGGRLAASGYPASVMFVQPELEGLLRDRLRAAANVTTRFGATVVGLEYQASATDAGVTVSFEQEGRQHTASGRFLVGCDGAASWVRRRVATPVEDLGFDEPWVVVDTLVRGDIGLPPRTAYQFCNPRRPTTCIPAGPGRQRWEFMLLPGESREAMGDPAQIWPLLEPWGGPATLELVRIAVYRFHAVIAARWRDGPVLLAGDAAHQTPPFMGQGLCSGVRDAANLAWRLDRVLDGRSNPALLDGYQREREPHVRHVVDTSVAMGRIVCELDEAKAQARDQAFLAARRAGRQALGATQGGQVAPLTSGLVRVGDAGAGALFPQPFGHRSGLSGRMDDVVGRGFRLFVEDAALLPSEARQGSAQSDAVPDPVVLGGHGADGFIETEAPGASSWLRERGLCAALVRPDHYVFGTATDAAGVSRLLDDLREALRV